MKLYCVLFIYKEPGSNKRNKNKPNTFHLMEIYSEINRFVVRYWFECSLFAFVGNIWTVPDIKDANPPFVLVEL